LKKGITVDEIENTVNSCKESGIRAYCSLIVGTPGENYEDYLLTKELMERLKPYKYGFNVFVGIPDSPLYQHILENRLYEYKDDLGLLYLPGYDVKTKCFYGLDSKSLVDYEFKQRTPFDRKLAKKLRANQNSKWSTKIFSVFRFSR